MADTGINILMYHSISDAPGPTSIPPETFRGQMRALAECGYQTISLSAFADWHAGRSELPPRPVVITFDDGFADFADTAFPELRARGWTATVFLPTGKMGGDEDWEGADRNPPRRLMNWRQVGELAGQGIDFGGHSVTHADLTRLAPDRLESEIRSPMEQIERRIGHAPVSFAPPYGRSNRLVRA
ncbi:MAG: polysaccharide deacetylase family protein, partial [Alphaproteobacteria bacterium]